MIDHLDHIVLTTNNEEACVGFYVGLLGVQLETFGTGRKAFRFGDQKINVHNQGARVRTEGGQADTRFAGHLLYRQHPLDSVIAQLNELKAPIVEGPVMRTGAPLKVRSVYLRDPDQNLIEISDLHP